MMRSTAVLTTILSAVEAARIVYQAREAVAELFGVPDPLRVCFGHNVTEGNGQPADATLTIRDAHLAEILRGNLDPQIAFVQGKLRVDGDINKAIEFGALLPKVIA